MKRFFQSSLAIALLAISAASAQALTISVVGGVSTDESAIGSSGQLQVIVDIAPENFRYTNGGLDVSIASSNPGVIQFTGASVADPTFFGGFVRRWAAGGAIVAGLTPDTISLLRGVALNTAGLDNTLPGNSIVPGGTQFLFATIDYQIVGPGMTEVGASGASGGDSFVNNGVPVTAVEFVSAPFVVDRVIPEPTTLGLAGLSLVGLVLRRRNG